MTWTESLLQQTELEHMKLEYKQIENVLFVTLFGAWGVREYVIIISWCTGIAEGVFYFIFGELIFSITRCQTDYTAWIWCKTCFSAFIRVVYVSTESKHKIIVTWAGTKNEIVSILKQVSACTIVLSNAIYFYYCIHRKQIGVWFTCLVKHK